MGGSNSKGQVALTKRTCKWQTLFLSEKKRRNISYLENWGGRRNIEGWHNIMRQILHALLAYFATKTWTIHNQRLLLSKIKNKKVKEIQLLKKNEFI